MRWYFDFFWLNIKGELLNGVGSFLLSLKLDSACHFIIILDFNFFYYAFRTFRWHKSSKIEKTFINVEYIGLDHVFDGIGLLLIL